MKPSKKASYHKEFKKQPSRYYRQGNLYDDQLKERNQKAAKETIENLRKSL